MLDVTLPIDASLGDFSIDDVPVTLTDVDLFQSPAPSIDFDAESLLASAIENFKDFSATDLMGIFNGLSTWLNSFRGTDLFDVEIPLTKGKTLSSC